MNGKRDAITNLLAVAGDDGPEGQERVVLFSGGSSLGLEDVGEVGGAPVMIDDDAVAASAG